MAIGISRFLRQSLTTALAGWICTGIMTLVIAIAPCESRAQTAGYTITDLGSLGGNGALGYGINANGQVAGGSYTSQSVQVPCPPHQYGGSKKCFTNPEHAFLWSSGSMSDLGTLGGMNSEGRAVNLSGQVAGWSETKNGGHDAFVTSRNKLIDLGASGPLVGWESQATGINDFGDVVGWWGFNPGNHAFLYSNGNNTTLPDLSSYNGGESAAAGINNLLQIVGTSADANGNNHAVLWQNGQITDLGTLGGPTSSANAINNNSVIVGASATSTGGAYFLDQNGTMTEVATDSVGDMPTSINSSDVFVTSAAFIYSNGTLQNLNNLIPPGSGYSLIDATGINDNGQIVAIAHYSGDGIYHSLLLTPY